MSKNVSGQAAQPGAEGKPRRGDRFRCAKCALEVEVVSGCSCEGNCAKFQCCGQPMEKVAA